MIVVDYVGEYEPYHGSPEAGGYDLRATLDKDFIQIRPGETQDISLGIHAQPPVGYIGFLLIRSGTSKRDLMISTCVSAIDCDYTGDIVAYIKNTGDQDQKIMNGERIVQIVYVECAKVLWNRVSMLRETQRGSGGFGSTGR